MDWREGFDAELERAQRARAGGNEGKARVCARRAAGLLAVEYLRRHASVPRTPSAIDALNHLRHEPSIPPDLIPLIDHLLQPVDTDFRLPEGVDLLAETRRLREVLLPD